MGGGWQLKMLIQEGSSSSGGVVSTAELCDSLEGERVCVCVW